MIQTCNVFQNSADAIESILNLHFPDGKILDVTWGLGTFYKKVRRDITGIDIRPDGNPTLIADNRFLPFQNDSFSVGVLDPPYKRGNRNTRYTDRYGIAPCTEPRVTKSYLEALPELIRASKNGIIIKAQDASDGHTFHPRHIWLCSWMKDFTGLNVYDIVTIVRKFPPQANTQGKQRFFQQAMSYFLIYRWDKKDPFQPHRN